MDQVKLGTFTLCRLNVELYAMPNQDGGLIYFTPTDDDLPSMKIGLRYDHWYEVLDTLLHESFEFAFIIARLRYIRCGKLNRDHADYLFQFDHCQFADACSHVAEFLDQVFPVLRKAWENRNKKKAARRRKKRRSKR